MAKKSAPSFPSSQRFVLDGEKLMEELSACQFFFAGYGDGKWETKGS